MQEDTVNEPGKDAGFALPVGIESGLDVKDEVKQECGSDRETTVAEVCVKDEIKEELTDAKEDKGFRGPRWPFFSFQVGEQVRAFWEGPQRQTGYYPAKVIAYDEVKDKYKISFHEPGDWGDNVREPWDLKRVETHYEEGDFVYAYYDGDNYVHGWFPATVKEVNGDGTYTLFWRDGRGWGRPFVKPFDHITVVDVVFNVGDRVRAFYMGTEAEPQWCHAIIKEKHSTGRRGSTYRVEWDKDIGWGDNVKEEYHIQQCDGESDMEDIRNQFASSDEEEDEEPKGKGAVQVKSEFPQTAVVPNASFSARLPLWVRKCVEFQLAKKTWSPARPCCFPNCFSYPIGAPPRGDPPQACYTRMDKQTKREFREFVESGKAEATFRGRATKRRLKRLMHPERENMPRKSSGLPRERMLVTPEAMMEYPWMRQLPVRMFIGHGWRYTPERGIEKIPSSVRVPDTKVWYGRGQVVVPRESIAPILSLLGAPPQAGPTRAVETGDLPALGAPPQAGPTRGAEAGNLPVGISWCETMSRYDVAWRENKRKKHKYFCVKPLIAKGKNFQEAKMEALRAASEFNRKIRRKWNLPLTKSEALARTSCGVCGVLWQPESQSWLVRCRGKNKSAGKRVSPRNQSPEEIERTLRLAVTYRNQLWKAAGKPIPEDAGGMDFQKSKIDAIRASGQFKRNMKRPRHVASPHQSGARGVTWNARDNVWYVRSRGKG